MATGDAQPGRRPFRGDRPTTAIRSRLRRIAATVFVPVCVVVLAAFVAPPPAELSESIGVDLSFFNDLHRLGDEVRASLGLDAAGFLSLLQEDDEAAAAGAKDPGATARERGLRKRFPVVLIPGATSTSLEIWRGKPCAKAYFKQRLWGTMSMFTTLSTMDAACWLEHISLNLTTGLDPDGIKVGDG